MMGCKCLYLGMDDNRKDVGTTVVVRDLFYNQPVRRKYMQSSPKKVLHSVNKCVHRITLVHSNVSFKVVGIESEDELLRTIPSPSPLILLKRTFGTGVSNALHELNISDGRLELSGYISTPCNNLADKAFQYVYINSQFVCKGPIHKLLNQLANSFEFWDPGKAIDGSKNRKRSRPKAFTAYVLNLSCPRTFYDLTFESSKTYVEFKDRVPYSPLLIMPLRTSGRKRCLMDISRESGCHGADILEEDQMRKKGGNIKSADENLLDGDLSELSKFGKRKSRKSCQASPDLMDMLIQEDNHTSQKRYVRKPFEYTEAFNFQGQYIGIEFSSHTAYSFQSRDDTLDKCMVTTTQNKEDHFWKSDIKCFSDEDYILENRSSGGERSSNVEDNIFSSEWQDEPFKVDSSVGIDSATSRVSYDHHEFDSDVEYLVQPFLKNCSSKERFLCERDLCVDDGSRYQNDGFGNKRRRGGSYNCVQIPEIDGSKGFGFFSRTLWPEKESTARPLTRVVTKFDLPTEFDSSSRPLIKSLPHYEELFYEESSVIDVENLGSCQKTLNNDWCSLTSLSQNTYLDFEPISDINAVEGHYRYVKRATNKYFVDGEEKNCTFSYDITDSLVPQSINKNCLSDCRVLRQVDKKYIAVMAGTTLAVIDQHAADERIRLEELRQKVLPEIGYQLLHNYAKPVEGWGWLCNTLAQGSGSFKRHLNLLHRQPTAVTYWGALHPRCQFI